MRNIITEIVLLLLSFMLISCGNTGESSENKIIYWSSNNTDEINFAKVIVDNWDVKYQDKKVQFQPVPEGQSSEEVILAAVVGETTPDIYSNMWQGDVELYARAGKLVPLDTLPGFLPFIYARCDSEVVNEVTSSDGHIYQIPWKINPIMMIYNEKIFENMGYKNPPATYSEYLKAAAEVKKNNIKDGYVDKWIGYTEVDVTWWQREFDFYSLYLAASNGGHLVQSNKAVFDNKYAVETFRFLKTLFDNKYFPREKLSAKQDPFLSSDIATRFTGPWEIVHANKFKPKGFRFNFATLPVPDDHKGKIYTYGDTKNIVMFNTCKNKLLAWQFIKTIISKEGDFELLKMTSQIPRRKDLTTDKKFADFFNENPQMQIFAVQAKYVKGPDNCPVLKEVFDAISQQFEECVVYGKKSPEEAVKDAAENVNLILLQQ